MICYKLMKIIFLRLASAGIFLSGVLFFFGCISAPSHHPKQEGIMEHATPTLQGEIRILTINVWSGLTYKGFFKVGRHPDNPENRYGLLVSEIRKLNPDVITIQEANPLPPYANRLAADLDYKVIYSVALGGIRFGSLGIPTNMREGDAILVKKLWTIEEVGRKRLSGGGIATNWFCFHLGEIIQVLLGKAVVNGTPLYLYNVHLHSGPFHGPALEAALTRLTQEMPQQKMEEAQKGVKKDIERRRIEIANLMRFVEETLPPSMPAIILGDFNTTVESGELEPLLAEGKWVDSFRLKNPHNEGVTWDPRHNPNFRHKDVASNPYDVLCTYHDRHPYRIDFILVNENITREHILLESRVVLTPVDGLSPSDHYGVLTTLKW